MDNNTSEPATASLPPKISKELIRMPLPKLTSQFRKFLTENGYGVPDGLSINLTVSISSSSRRRSPSDPPVRCYDGKVEAVILGVPPEIETHFVQDDLEAQGYPVYGVQSMSRGDGTELNRVMAILLNTDKTKRIFTDLKTVCGLNVTVACPYAGKYYDLCRRCRWYGHTADECTAVFYNMPDPDTVDELEREIRILANEFGMVAVNSGREEEAPATSERLPTDIRELLRTKNAALRLARAYPTRENKAKANALQRKVRARIQQFRNENY